MQALNIHSYSAVLLDIEGTTTPVDFVYQTLFPFARNHVGAFLRQYATTDEVRSIIKTLCEENATDREQDLNAPAISSTEDLPAVVAYVQWLIDIDRKSTPLKDLQGMIWEAGYQSGELRSEIFADVPAALARWREQGTVIAIFSSGSVLAQKLLFAHTAAGDLTGYLTAYFDTNIGAKREAESYRRIAEELQKPAAEIRFISDITAELDAAETAGMQTLLALRPSNAPQPSFRHTTIHTFAEIFATPLGDTP
jgi:enolase-phosphatase E1